jgi:hypothetical protein
MKFRHIVATMIGLGLVSGSAFAANTTKHKMKHQNTTTTANRDYKDYKDLPQVCTISPDTMILTARTQNMGRSLPNPCNPGWFNRIQFSGGVNVDLGKFGNRNMNYMGENYQRFSLNDAYLNVAATVNDWAKAFASLSYNTATINPGLTGATLGSPTTLSTVRANAEYDAAYSNNVSGGSTSSVQLEQAFATFGNFDASPFYLQVGKQFADFSSYEIHPITESLTQVMSEVLATQGKLGFVASGFNGSVYVFDDPIAKVGQTTNTTNYGASLGYAAPSDQLGWDLGIGYLYNMIGANNVAYTVNQYNNAASFYATGTTTGFGPGYNSRVAAGSLYGDVNSGPFSLGVRYTTALQKFNSLDLPKNLANASPTGTGAKPWAAGATAAYGFEGWNRDQNVYLGYQASGQAAYLNVPKSRWLVGYGIDAFGKNTNIGVEWDHDMAYSRSNGGKGNNANLVSLRSSVEFG